MAGAMWRRSVVLLMVCAWQACTAENLVNLWEPQLTAYAPQEMLDVWQLFDHDKSTYAAVGQVKVHLKDSSTISPTKYRITMAEHVKPKHYPRTWRLTIGQIRPKEYRVENAVFENGVYEATLPWRDPSKIELEYIRINFNSRTESGRNRNPRQWQAIAEVELLGPRKALNTFWPYGKYPCSQRNAIITPKEGPKTIFSRSKYATSKEELRRVFDTNGGEPSPYWFGATTKFYYDGVKPVIIGAEFPELPMVHEVAVLAAFTRDSKHLKSVVLEGHRCSPRSNTGKCKGWEQLAEAAGPSDDNTQRQRLTRLSRKTAILRLLVENPGEYKAYRVKFIPMKRRTGDSDNAKIAQVKGIYFLGCTA